MNKKYGLFYLLLLTFCLTSCLSGPYYQKEESVPQNAWSYNFRPSFSIDIKDTVANYKAFFLIQHTQSYPYNNLWVWVYIKAPGDSTVTKERINVPLAEATGKWLGRGMGEIWEQRMPIDLGDSIKFNKQGTYQVTLEQNMRINPLPEVLHVGFRLEKVGIRH